MSKSVLSIQSHVAHGYVGGKAAIFPLQTQGWDVDNINTVNFSNHTGYGSVKGSAIDGTSELKPILDQLFNKLHLQYNAIITGYIPNSELIGIISDNISQFKKQHKSTLYLLDPVMGDNNYLYVDESCVEEYKKILGNKLVDIITPNQFELELIVGYKITSPLTLRTAIDTLHNEFNIKYVVITSLNSDFIDQKQERIYCAISTPHSHIQLFKIPIIKSYFTGVGDLFSALLLDKLYINMNLSEDSGAVLSRSVNQVLTIMSKTLKLTHTMALQEYNKTTQKSSNSLVGKINDGDTMKYFELRIIQSRKFFDYVDDGEFHPQFLSDIESI
ncbi:Ribokinase-like protein [Scheffersomyces xylosifermentans]|uniref:Ribokinase-like protein n=1 Tax=Scheffersomyces xylosifermentans TaxID=1304137 RepID=UPI00315C8899